MTNAFSALGLSEGIASALTELGYEEPTPIQTSAIPSLLNGRDVLGQAATGTGKTAAFALPLIERYIVGSEASTPLVMILTPTRELCLQVAESFINFGKNIGIRVAPIYGGQEYGRQIRLLQRGVHVVVATPGRALDHIARGTLDLSNIQALVLDEADEMLDMGFADELDAILQALPEQHQTALFSATLPSRIQAIADSHLKDPDHIVIAREKTSEGEVPRVPQIAYMVGRAHRLAALGRILDVESSELAIVFARTRNEVDEVTEGLRHRGFTVEALHGGLDQASRDRVMKRAKNGTLEVVVATDVAARGIDLDNVTHVINFGIPASLETYVHRIGRTGRAGRSGVAITVLEPREHRQLRSLEGITKAKIELRSVPSVTDVRAKRMELTRAAVNEELLADNFDKYRVLVEQLCEDADVFDVAAAAIAYADRLAGGQQDEDEIPTVTPFERKKRPLSDKPRERMSNREAEQGMTRIFIGAGREMGIKPGDIVGAIANEAGIASRRIGAIEISDRFSLVEVDSPVAMAVITALRETTIKGRNVTVKKDQPKRSAGYRDVEQDGKRGHYERRERAPKREPRKSRFDE
ncbi:MAG: DEAD/DEAH box helicase [Duodenibacillus sp.]|nr:DEAD/DEAH box helicase [Duodenibacillus sp.]